MATIKQRGKVVGWQVKKAGVRKSGTCTNERKAVVAAAKAEEAIAAGLLGKAPKGSTVADVLDRYLNEVTALKPSWKTLMSG